MFRRISTTVRWVSGWGHRATARRSAAVIRTVCALFSSPTFSWLATRTASAICSSQGIACSENNPEAPSTSAASACLSRVAEWSPPQVSLHSSFGLSGGDKNISLTRHQNRRIWFQSISHWRHCSADNAIVLCCGSQNQYLVVSESEKLVVKKWGFDRLWLAFAIESPLSDYWSSYRTSKMGSASATFAQISIIIIISNLYSAYYKKEHRCYNKKKNITIKNYYKT